MKKKEQTGAYDALIKKIRTARFWTVLICAVLVLITVFLTFPIHIEISGKTLVDYDGLNVLLSILIILVLLGAGALVYAIAVSSPLSRAMSAECDPEKHLALNTGVSKLGNKDGVCSEDLLYMGRFDESLKHAEKMIRKKNPEQKLTGLYNKVRCLFHKDDFGEMRQCAQEYASELNAAGKLSGKKRERFVEMEKEISLHVAIADGDKESISALCNGLRPRSASRAVKGYTEYLLGMGYYALDDKKECRSRMKYVRDKCEKTVFASLAEKYM